MADEEAALSPDGTAEELTEPADPKDLADPEPCPPAWSFSPLTACPDCAATLSRGAARPWYGPGDPRPRAFPGGER
eukprot:6914140-Alexandrium_andersonii.AAC.1